ncbi:hypothetical protein HO459_11200 [Streptococcus suis]|uniref:Agglutinin receptor n=1 Tax=Streptococcus suis TaxID=1307 RepID=A0A7T3RH91_STRSU|nr:hypothetical protein CWM22_06350 [Streptococcus suis]MCK3910046.1 hypothetical protein [Streptococcus suis]MCK3985321.1 hypothetical protein [Streptococcus suis]MCK4072485.1 hypothetical protein [Streptococcus suis]NQJ59709.1 hypothetical protein [Streptococcus suis]
MRQSSSFFIFKYSSEVIGCASDSFFLFPELIVITKSSLLFYDGIELGLRAVQKREFLLERKVLRQNSYFCHARITPSYLIKSDSLLLHKKEKKDYL